MQQLFKIFIGILFLIIGIPIGNYLARITSDEIKPGQKWFKVIIVLSLAGGFAGLIINDDVLMFSLFFIAIVTSRSLNR